MQLRAAQVGEGQNDDEPHQGQLQLQRRVAEQVVVGGHRPAGRDQHGERGEGAEAEAPRDGPHPLSLGGAAQDRHHGDPEDDLAPEEEGHCQHVQVQNGPPEVTHRSNPIRDRDCEDAAVPAFRIVVLASGNGSNLQAILDRLQGREGIEVVGVGSDKPGARALERAAAAGVDTALFPASEFEDREARDEALGDWIESLGADLIALAGYMQLLSAGFIERFRNRVVNVHPALLPAFPGLDAIGQALTAGVKTTGVTVHFVDEGIDTGPAIIQRQVPVPDGGREKLEAAVHALEHELYPEAIRMIARGLVRIDADQRVAVIDERSKD